MAAVGLFVWLSQRVLRAQRWKALAMRCGLSDIRQSDGLRATYRGQDGTVELHVRVESFVESFSQAPPDAGKSRERMPLVRTRVTIDGAGRLVPLSLSPELRGELWPQHALREIQVGDDAFDEDFIVNGPPAFVRAVLDADTRELLRRLLAGADVRVQNGRVQGDIPPIHSLAAGAKAIPLEHALPMLLALAKQLRRPPDPARRLAHLAVHDSLPGVRAANLLTLAAEYADDPLTAPVLVAACGDESDHVRVEAAIALGERGRGTLLEITRATLDDRAGARAVAALAPHLSLESAKEALGQALRARLLETARACLAWLAKAGSADATGLVVKVLRVEKGDLAVAAVEALAATGSPAAEPPLVAALERLTPDLDLGLAAARALGRIGSAAAVLPLKEAEARHGRDIAFGRAARQAIAEIQSRLGGASPGQVSLAAAEAGTLSLVDDERGRLSLKDRSG